MPAFNLRALANRTILFSAILEPPSDLDMFDGSLLWITVGLFGDDWMDLIIFHIVQSNLSTDCIDAGTKCTEPISTNVIKQAPAVDDNIGKKKENVTAQVFLFWIADISSDHTIPM